MLHIYYGEGKGKTTCAMGLALRCVGRNIPVVIAQFLKGDDSGERRILEQLPGVILLPLPQQVKFTFQMTAEEKLEAGEALTRRLQTAFRLAQEQGGLLVLDEICAALSAGMVELPLLEELLNRSRPALEVVLTGRDPADSLLRRADYVTEFRKERHPFDRGISARPGIEY